MSIANSPIRVEDLTDRHFIPASQAGGAPSELVEASETARGRYVDHLAACNVLIEAEQDLEEAEALDKRADRNAIAAGDDLPEPHAHEREARKQISEANRRKLATADIAIEAYRSYAALQVVHYPEWIAAQRAIVDRSVAAMEDAFAAARAAYLDTLVTGLLLGQLHSWSGKTTAAGALSLFSDTDIARMDHQLAGEMHQAKAKAETARASDMIPNKAGFLFANLERAAKTDLVTGPSIIEQQAAAAEEARPSFIEKAAAAAALVD